MNSHFGRVKLPTGGTGTPACALLHEALNARSTGQASLFTLVVHVLQGTFRNS
jgi:hypothetical protein